jgi:hypothetical protein
MKSEGKNLFQKFFDHYDAQYTVALITTVAEKKYN